MLDFYESSLKPNTGTILMGVALTAIILFTCILSFLLIRGERPLYILNDGDENAVAVNTQPQLINFSELNDAPMTYLNQRIRVAGEYTPLASQPCDPASGPQFRWGLLDGTTQMNALGFDSVLKLLPSGTLIQVDGFWRRYEGPLGCGKQPNEGVAFYLEVTDIVQPNPLVGSDGVVLIITPTPLPQPTISNTTTITTTPIEVITITQTLTPISTGDVISNSTNTPTPTPSQTPTATPSRTPTASATLPPDVTLTPTNTATPSLTPTRTPTIDPSSSPTPTTDPDSSPTPSRTPEPFPTDPDTDPVPTLPQTTPDDGGYPPPPYP